ncbi:hypothetical protein H1R20_g16232, partial [Candolleomyces eurysporus]
MHAQRPTQAPFLPPTVGSAALPGPVHAYAATTGHPLGSYVANATAGAFQVPAFAFNPMLHHTFAPGSMPNSSASLGAPLRSAQGLSPHTCPPLPSSWPIDPSLLPPPTREENLENVAAGNPDDSRRSDDSSGETDSDGSESVEESGSTSDVQKVKKSSTASAKKRRLYPSDKNAHHGHIEGVGRGNRMIKMARKRPLKAVYTNQRTSSASFRALTRDLMTRAEDIANRTASWLYVAIHNPGASQPFTHFASRRLRLEAPDDLQKIHQQVASLMTVLKRADRSHSFQSEKEKEEAIQKMKEATERAEKATAQAANSKAEILRLREELRITREGQTWEST